MKVKRQQKQEAEMIESCVLALRETTYYASTAVDILKHKWETEGTYAYECKHSLQSSQGDDALEVKPGMG